MSKKINDSLNDILQFLHDSSDCYEKNMEDVSDEDLKELFGYLSQQRLQMIAEIKNSIIELGGEPKNSSALIDRIYEFDEVLKDIIASEKPFDMMEEVRRGENMLIECYSETLKHDVPEKVKSLLLNHLAQIGEELKRVDVAAVKTTH